MQSEHHDWSLIHTATGQAVLAVAAIIAVIAIAWFYVF
jgi:hypothetical protein